MSTPDLVLFDGVCHLCSGTVQWMLQRDRYGRFHYAPLQSDFARDLLHSFGKNAENLDSIVVIAGARLLERSDAVIYIAQRLGFPWSLAVIGRAFPRRWRDTAYDAIARRRYRWFGRYEACWAPRPEWSARFRG